MRRTGYALPKGSGKALVVIFRPDNHTVICDKASREFVVAILALVGQALLQPGRQMFPATALRLRKPVFGLAEFMRVRNLLARGESEERLKAWINAYLAIRGMRNGLRLCVNEQAEIPARRPLDDPATFEASCREVLGVEPDVPNPWHMDVCAVGSLERIREGDAGQFIAPALEPGLLRQFFIAPLPGCIRGIEHALQRVARDAELFAVVRQQIVEVFLGVIDAVFRILIDFADGPIPHAGELEQPGVKLRFLPSVQA